MPKGSKELTAARKDEIITACAELYKTMSFKEITIKDIGTVTSFTRTSIYNYFQTKEEIFLALLQREYELWIGKLEQIQARHENMTQMEFASALAHSLEERPDLLKLLSMNLYDMEENSRMERLIEFKVVYGRSLDQVDGCLIRFFPEMTKQERRDFIYLFFPFMLCFIFMQINKIGGVIEWITVWKVCLTHIFLKRIPFWTTWMRCL